MKKGKLVDLAFKKIGINTRTQSATPEETEDALYYLEMMITQWNGNGIRLGYAIEEEPQAETESNIPSWANEGVFLALAYRLTSHFEKPIPQTLVAEANAAMATIFAKTAQVNEIEYPARMPKGSGNYTVHRGKFYQPTDLIQTGGDFLADDGDDLVIP